MIGSNDNELELSSNYCIGVSSNNYQLSIERKAHMISSISSTTSQAMLSTEVASQKKSQESTGARPILTAASSTVRERGWCVCVFVGGGGGGKRPRG